MHGYSLETLKKDSTPEASHLVNAWIMDWMFPKWIRALKERIAYENYPRKCYAGACVFAPSYLGATSWLKTSVVITDQAFGGRSSGKTVVTGLKRGFTIAEVSWRTKGRGWQGDSCIQGMLPLDDRAGVAEWHMSRAPIIACPAWLHVGKREGEMAMVRAIDRSTMTACHFMKAS